MNFSTKKSFLLKQSRKNNLGMESTKILHLILYSRYAVSFSTILIFISMTLYPMLFISNRLNSITVIPGIMKFVSNICDYIRKCTSFWCCWKHKRWDCVDNKYDFSVLAIDVLCIFCFLLSKNSSFILLLLFFYINFSDASVVLWSHAAKS